MYMQLYNIYSYVFLAQSAGATEYTDYFSAEGKKLPAPNECPECDTKQSESEYPFIAIAPRSTLVRSGSTW